VAQLIEGDGGARRCGCAGEPGRGGVLRGCLPRNVQRARRATTEHRLMAGGGAVLLFAALDKGEQAGDSVQCKAAGALGQPACQQRGDSRQAMVPSQQALGLASGRATDA
jgi:hypothetical protein